MVVAQGVPQLRSPVSADRSRCRWVVQVLTISKLKRWSINYYIDTACTAERASRDVARAGGGLGEYYSEHETRTPTWMLAGDTRAVAQLVGLTDAQRAGANFLVEDRAQDAEDGVRVGVFKRERLDLVGLDRLAVELGDQRLGHFDGEFGRVDDDRIEPRVGLNVDLLRCTATALLGDHVAQDAAQLIRDVVDVGVLDLDELLDRRHVRRLGQELGDQLVDFRLHVGRGGDDQIAGELIGRDVGPQTVGPVSHQLRE